MSVLDHLPIEGHQFGEKLGRAFAVVQALASIVDFDNLIEVHGILFEKGVDLVLRLELVVVGPQVFVESFLFVDYILGVASERTAFCRQAVLNLVLEFEFSREALSEFRLKGFVCVLGVTELGLRLRWRSYVGALGALN